MGGYFIGWLDLGHGNLLDSEPAQEVTRNDVSTGL